MCDESNKVCAEIQTPTGRWERLLVVGNACARQMPAIAKHPTEAKAHNIKAAGTRTRGHKSTSGVRV